MKNVQLWKETKFRQKDGLLLPSISKRSPSFRMASYVAWFYSDQIPKHAKGRLLDLGCGNAPLYGFYQKYVQEVVCIDWDSSVHDIKYIDFACDLNKPIPIETGSFDVVICSDVLEHILSPKELLVEIQRVLKPNGKLLLNFPFMYGLHELPHDYFRYSEYFIEKVAAELGMKVLHIVKSGNLIDVWEDATLRLLQRIRFSKPMQYLFVTIIMPLLRKISSDLNKKGNRHPYMYGFVLEK